MGDELEMKRAEGVDEAISAMREELKLRLNRELSREEPGGAASEAVQETLHELVAFLDRLGRSSADTSRQLELVVQLEEGVRRSTGHQHHVEIVLRTNGLGRCLAGMRRLVITPEEDWIAKSGWEPSISEAVNALARNSIHAHRPIATLFAKLDELVR
jgi:hypothetical protein